MEAPAEYVVVRGRVADGHWWVDEGKFLYNGGYAYPELSPTVALLAWTHERKRLHRAPIETCPSCDEYRRLYGEPPPGFDLTQCLRWLQRRRQEQSRRRAPHVKRLRCEIKGALWWEILERDDFRCRHCGVRRFLTVDHIIALDNGGTNERENLQTLCRNCNSRKGNR
jgi:5-methylcytosine-specific restriction endonuclease McrA